MSATEWMAGARCKLKRDVAAAADADLENDFIMDLQHLAEAKGFQARIALNAKHRTHDNVSSATCKDSHVRGTASCKAEALPRSARKHLEWACSQPCEKRHRKPWRIGSL